MVVRQMLALEQHRLIRNEPKPAKVIERRLRQLRPAAKKIDVFDANQEAALPLARHLLVEERRIGVAEMKPAIGARRKTECGADHAGAIVQSPCSSQTEPRSASLRAKPISLRDWPISSRVSRALRRSSSSSVRRLCGEPPPD